MGKPRSDSKLDNLPEHQWMQLRDGLLSRKFKGYEEALSWLLLECGVSSTLSALSAFYKRHCKTVVSERRKWSAMRAEAVGDAIAETQVDYDALAIDKVKQALFEMLDSETPIDAGEAKKLADIIFKDRATALDRDKLTAASKTQIEKGLDALLQEIKGNKKALAAFQTIQLEVQK